MYIEENEECAAIRLLREDLERICTDEIMAKIWTNIERGLASIGEIMPERNRDSEQ